MISRKCVPMLVDAVEEGERRCGVALNAAGELERVTCVCPPVKSAEFMPQSYIVSYVLVEVSLALPAHAVGSVSPSRELQHHDSVSGFCLEQPTTGLGVAYCTLHLLVEQPSRRYGVAHYKLQQYTPEYLLCIAHHLLLSTQYGHDTAYQLGRAQRAAQ